MHARCAYALIAAAAALLPAAGRAGDSRRPPAASKPDPVLVQVVDGDWRTAAEKARDQYRHPVEALTFWGLKPGMTILEVQPGAGWWTDILAPYAKRTGGKLYVTGADLANPELSEARRKARADFEARYAANPALYGKIDVVNWGPKSAPLPEGHVRLHPDRALGAQLDGHARHGREELRRVLRRIEAGRHPRARAAPRESGAAGSEGCETATSPRRSSSRRPSTPASSWWRSRRSTPTRRTPRTIRSACGRCRRRCDPAPRARVRRTIRPSTTRSTSRSASPTAWS